MSLHEIQQRRLTQNAHVLFEPVLKKSLHVLVANASLKQEDVPVLTLISYFK